MYFPLTIELQFFNTGQNHVASVNNNYGPQNCYKLTVFYR